MPMKTFVNVRPKDDARRVVHLEVFEQGEEQEAADRSAALYDEYPAEEYDIRVESYADASTWMEMERVAEVDA